MTAAALAAVGRTSLSASVMILAAIVLRVKFQERTPRRVFCLLWDIILVRLLVLAEIPSPVSVRRFLPDFTSQPEVTAVPGIQMVGNWSSGVEIAKEVYVTSAVENTAAAALVPPMSWEAVLTAIWLIGAAALGLWLLLGHLRCRRDYDASLPVRDEFVLNWLAEHPLRRPVQVRSSDRIASPLTYGLLYPVVLLPRGLDCEDKSTLSWVLAHEFTHIRRFDALRKGLLAAALCLHWFNPLVWAMYAFANRDMELACDEAVLQGRSDREGYALALLGMEERRGGRTFTGFSQNALEERIRAIMKHKHTSITALLAVLIVMSLATTVFATAAPEKKPDSDQNSLAYAGPQEQVDIISIINGETGEEEYSDNGGETWMNEESYQAKYGSWGENWTVKWWTYDEYKAWLEQEKINLQEVIGSKGWTPSTGWFTWDQKMVDETIAEYENILEKIRKGALVSKVVLDKDGNELQDVMLGSDAPITGFTEAMTSDAILEHNIDFDAGKLLEELKAFGITGDENVMYYNGQRIRNFVDGAPVGSDEFSVQYVHTDESGTVDVHTLRSVIRNPDGSYDIMGDLIGVAASGDANFNQELIDSAAYDRHPQIAYHDTPVQVQYQSQSKREAATAEGSSRERGRTFEEIFARYADFGLSYQPGETGEQLLTLNGQPVSSFADVKPNGGVFSFENPYAADGLRLVTQYGQDGTLTGLTEA